MSESNKIYKNSPLVEAVFEIRFLGEPAIECHRDEFYEKVRNIYSKVFVPSPVTALEPYKFEREDGLAGIMLSINKMAFYCKKYEGFSNFKKEALSVFSILGELFRIQTLSRIGLRYINFIPYAKENDLILLNNYLTIKLSLPESIPQDFKNLGIVFVSKIGEDALTTRIEPAKSADTSQQVIILDFDYVKTGDLKFGSLNKYLDESHIHTKKVFEGLITDRYKKFMRGETI